MPSPRSLGLGLTLLVLVAVGAALLGSTDNAVPTEAPTLAPREAPGHSDPAPGATSETRDAAGRQVIQASSGAPRKTVAELVAQIEAQFEGEGPVSIDRPLQELTALGTPEAAEAFAKLLETDRPCWFWRGALSGAFLMHPFESKAIREAAWRETERLRGQPEHARDWDELLPLVAWNGGPEEAQKLVQLDEELQAGETGQDQAALLLWRLADHSTGPHWLERLDSSPAARDTIAGGLAAWHDPATDAELWELAEGSSSEIAAAVLGGLGTHAQATEGVKVLAELDHLEPLRATSLLEGLANNDAFVEEHQRELETRLPGLLDSAEPNLARAAARFVAANQALFMTEDLAAKLVTLRNEGRLPADLAPVLVHYERTHREDR